MSGSTISANVASVARLTDAQAAYLPKDGDPRLSTNSIRQATVHLTGQLELAWAETAWHLVSLRHEALRSVFVYRGVDRPVQVVLVQRPADVASYELTGYDALTRGRQAAQIKDFELEPGFDFQRDALVKARFVHQSDDLSLLVITYHPVILDDWSLQLLVQDFLIFYERLAAGAGLGALTLEAEARSRAGLRLHDWVRRYMAEPDELGYWSELVAGTGQVAYPPQLEPVTERESGWQSEAQRRLSLDDSGLVRAALGRGSAEAAGLGIDLTAAAGAAWALVLGRITGQREVVFGRLVDDRGEVVTGSRLVPAAEVARLAGPLAHVVPVRAGLDPALTAGELLTTLVAQAGEVQYRARCPLAELDAAAALNQPLSTRLVVEQPVSLTSAGRFQARLDSVRQQAATPLTAVIADEPRGIKLTLKYGPDYAPADANRLLDWWERALLGLVTSQDSRLDEIDIAPAAETSHTLAWAAGEDLDLPAGLTIDSLVTQAAAEAPATTAVMVGTRTYSRAQLNQACRQIAAELTAAGVEPGQRVAVWGERGVRAIATSLAIWRLGAVFVPLWKGDRERPASQVEEAWSAVRDHPSQPLVYFDEADSRNTLLLEKARPVALVALSPSWPLAEGVNTVNLTEAEFWACIEDPSRAEAVTDSWSPLELADDAAAVVVTTAAGDQVIELSQRALIALCLNPSLDVLFDHEQPRLMAVADPGSIQAVAERLAGLIRAIPVIIARDVDLASPTLFAGLIWQWRATILAASEAQLAYLASDEQELGVWTSLRRLVLHSETYATEPLRHLAPYTKASWFQAYGSPETTLWTTIGQVTPDGRQDIGRPLAGSRAYVLDGLRPCAIGQIGELCVGGEQVAAGYIGDPAASAGRFIDNPYAAGRLFRTGQAARWLPDRRLDLPGHGPTGLRYEAAGQAGEAWTWAIPPAPAAVEAPAPIKAPLAVAQISPTAIPPRLEPPPVRFGVPPAPAWDSPLPGQLPVEPVPVDQSGVQPPVAHPVTPPAASLAPANPLPDLAAGVTDQFGSPSQPVAESQADDVVSPVTPVVPDAGLPAELADRPVPDEDPPEPVTDRPIPEDLFASEPAEPAPGDDQPAEPIDPSSWLSLGVVPTAAAAWAPVASPLSASSASPVPPASPPSASSAASPASPIPPDTPGSATSAAPGARGPADSVTPCSPISPQGSRETESVTSVFPVPPVDSFTPDSPVSPESPVSLDSPADHSADESAAAAWASLFPSGTKVATVDLNPAAGAGTKSAAAVAGDGDGERAHEGQEESGGPDGIDQSVGNLAGPALDTATTDTAGPASPAEPLAAAGKPVWSSAPATAATPVSPSTPVSPTTPAIPSTPLTPAAPEALGPVSPVAPIPTPDSPGSAATTDTTWPASSPEHTPNSPLTPGAPFTPVESVEATGSTLPRPAESLIAAVPAEASTPTSGLVPAEAVAESESYLSQEWRSVQEANPVPPVDRPSPGEDTGLAEVPGESAPALRPGTAGPNPTGAAPAPHGIDVARGIPPAKTAESIPPEPAEAVADPVPPAGSGVGESVPPVESVVEPEARLEQLLARDHADIVPTPVAADYIAAVAEPDQSSPPAETPTLDRAAALLALLTEPKEGWVDLNPPVVVTNLVSPTPTDLVSPATEPEGEPAITTASPPGWSPSTAATVTEPDSLAEPAPAMEPILGILPPIPTPAVEPMLETPVDLPVIELAEEAGSPTGPSIPSEEELAVSTPEPGEAAEATPQQTDPLFQPEWAVPTSTPPELESLPIAELAGVVTPASPVSAPPPPDQVSAAIPAWGELAVTPAVDETWPTPISAEPISTGLGQVDLVEPVPDMTGPTPILAEPPGSLTPSSWADLAKPSQASHLEWAELGAPSLPPEPVLFIPAEPAEEVKPEWAAEPTTTPEGGAPVTWAEPEPAVAVGTGPTELGPWSWPEVGPEPKAGPEPGPGVEAVASGTDDLWLGLGMAQTAAALLVDFPDPASPEASLGTDEPTAPADLIPAAAVTDPSPVAEPETAPTSEYQVAEPAPEAALGTWVTTDSAGTPADEPIPVPETGLGTPGVTTDSTVTPADEPIPVPETGLGATWVTTDSTVTPAEPVTVPAAELGAPWATTGSPDTPDKEPVSADTLAEPLPADIRAEPTPADGQAEPTPADGQAELIQADQGAPDLSHHLTIPGAVAVEPPRFPLDDLYYEAKAADTEAIEIAGPGLPSAPEPPRPEPSPTVEDGPIEPASSQLGVNSAGGVSAVSPTVEDGPIEPVPAELAADQPPVSEAVIQSADSGEPAELEPAELIADPALLQTEPTVAAVLPELGEPQPESAEPEYAPVEPEPAIAIPVDELVSPAPAPTGPRWPKTELAEPESEPTDTDEPSAGPEPALGPEVPEAESPEPELIEPEPEVLEDSPSEPGPEPAESRPRSSSTSSAAAPPPVPEEEPAELVPAEPEPISTDSTEPESLEPEITEPDLVELTEPELAESELEPEKPAEPEPATTETAPSTTAEPAEPAEVGPDSPLGPGLAEPAEPEPTPAEPESIPTEPASELPEPELLEPAPEPAEPEPEVVEDALEESEPEAVPAEPAATQRETGGESLPSPAADERETRGAPAGPEPAEPTVVVVPATPVPVIPAPVLAPLTQPAFNGPVALTARQRYYLDAGHTHHGQHTHAVLLQAPGFDPRLLGGALTTLATYHDALRLHFPAGEAHIRPAAEAERAFRLTIVNVTQASPAAIDARIDRIRAGFDITQGPLLRAILFTGDPAGDRLALIAHELAFDRPSWPILLGDLALAYDQAARGRPMALDRVKFSWPQWLDALQQQSAGLRASVYWEWLPELANQSRAHDVGSRLAPAAAPRRVESAQVQRTVAATTAEPGVAVRPVIIDPVTTEKLLVLGIPAYGLDPDDLVAAATAATIRAALGQPVVTADQMTTGRHSPDHDLSRTVGAFPASHPVVLDPGTSLEQGIVDIIEARRVTPGGPLAYGLAGLRPEWQGAPYIPSLALYPLVTKTGEETVLTGLFTWQDWPLTPPVGPADHPDHSLAIKPQLQDGQLRLDIISDTSVLAQTTVTALALELQRQLGQIVAALYDQALAGRTAADFSAPALGDDELSEITTIIGG